MLNRKYILFTLIFLFCVSIQAQDKFLEMSKGGTDKVRTFKENKRVKVKTIEGEKYIGRFQIVDNSSIEIKGNNISLDSISNIKSRSVVAGVAGTILIIYGSLWMAAGGFLHIYPGDPPVGNGLLIAGAVLTSAGIFFNEFARNQRNENWSYKIIEK